MTPNVPHLRSRPLGRCWRCASSLRPLHCASSLRSVTATASAARYTLSLHDALPIFLLREPEQRLHLVDVVAHDHRHDRDLPAAVRRGVPQDAQRSEEHTSELQSLRHLVCRLLLETTTRTTAQGA